MRWVGIDEAGYGPNLGPLVLAAVVAETADDRRPDLWGGPAPLMTRAGGAKDRLWVDDSKRLYRGGAGLDRLEAASLAVLAAAGLVASWPIGLGSLLASLCGCSLDEAELPRWLDGDEPEPFPAACWSERVAGWLATGPFEGAGWRIAGARAVVVGPEAFNALLGPDGRKSRVHAAAFGRLLRWLWDAPGDGGTTIVRSDKHGGRHFYADLLEGALPGAEVQVVAEGPGLSRYVVGGERHRWVVEFAPRADADDGLVVLASILSKMLRERWMAAFNAFWSRRLPGLRPTAGYPTDARRFRAVIEPLACDLGLDTRTWWRAK